MDRITRRGVLAGGATLASVAIGRKPWAQTILTLKDPAPVRLQGIEALVATVPAVALAAQGFADGEGRPVSLESFAGKGVVLNLWATWCVPCVAEMPALDGLSQRLAAEGIVVVPLSSDRGGMTVVRRFYEAHAIGHLGIWLDPKGVAASNWGVRGLPTTIILDRGGHEQARLEGGALWSSDAAVARIRQLVG